MTISIEQTKLSLQELIAKTSHDETIVITQSNVPVAELRRVTPAKPAPIFGSCRGMLTIVSDDNDHLTDFAGYMQ